MYPHPPLYSVKGFRHDSGDPVQYGEAVIKLYQSVGIDPRDKLLIFSDGLTVHKMIELYEHFAGRIRVTFGVGTHLSFDFGEYIKAISLVMKVVEAAGVPTVKLSNNRAKATGPKSEIAFYRDEVFNHTDTYREEVVY